jgi:hypothetical protein
MVGVQHRHHVRLDDLQGVVEVPGLGVATVGPPQVAGTQIGGQAFDLRPTAVVQQPGLVPRSQGDRGRDGRGEHPRRLVPGRDQHRHLERGLGHRPCPRPGVDIPQGEDIQPEPDRRVQLQHQQRDRQPPHPQVDRGHHPPHQIDHGDRQGQHGHGTGKELAQAATFRSALIREPGEPGPHLGDPTSQLVPVCHADPWVARDYLQGNRLGSGGVELPRRPPTDRVASTNRPQAPVEAVGPRP